MSKPEAKCSFCQKARTEVRVLILGLNGHTICDACAQGAAKVIADADEQAAAAEPERTPAKLISITAWRKAHSVDDLVIP